MGLRLYKHLVEYWIQDRAYFKSETKVPNLPSRIAKEKTTAYSLPVGTRKHKIHLDDFDDLNIEQWGDLNFAFDFVALRPGYI
ncbi:hypothetical protein J2N86_08530 [Legionella lytica]|uniref:Uncharacterized protein n=1 Tax=Legionella lytica TaxID=96232 RepID=A0ABY4Y566_9GAMM|nr:hypothetical protein [Legionella lytica]USQ12753.1 hypothetical protein J2N86_08530 [Legionella lytica]